MAGLKKIQDIESCGTFGKIKLRKRDMIPKGWGAFIDKSDFSKIGEILVWHNKYRFMSPQEDFEVGTVKLLYIEKDKKFSLHFHVKKTEIFYCIKGSFLVRLIADGEEENILFEPGESMLILPGMVHQMTGLEEENILLEVSTVDKKYDSYRIQKGD